MATGEEGREIDGRPQPITPLDPTSNITSNSQTQFVHPNTQAVDEAFVMDNYLQTLMRRELEAPPGSQPLGGMEEPAMEGIPPTASRSFTRNKKEEKNFITKRSFRSSQKSRAQSASLWQQPHVREGKASGRRQTEANFAGYNMYPPNNVYPPSIYTG
ncbi:hypothetical protein Tco_1060389 [Tanacetum coccineum]